MSKLSSFRLLESYLEDLSVLVDESKRLVELDLSYEHNNHEVRKSLQKIVKFLERHDDGEDYDELVEQFNKLRDSIQTIDTSPYRYVRKAQVPKKVEAKKSVRFNENLEFEAAQDSTPRHFKPYRDSVIQEPDNDQTQALFEGRSDVDANVSGVDDDVQSVESTNQDMFIQHQQQLLEQDTHLDSLAESVRRQHGLSVEINDELEGQHILLDDLEAQLDSSDRRLNQGHRRLKHFTRKAKEHGQWITIIVLIIILVLLLVVLK
ncbi:Syntaxin-8 AltName: Full=SNARE protein related to mammalian syntaxin 8; AltName: Full=ULP1-interacting protein 2 [Cyberlindnera jadinii]|uniref:t-SNARE coiled-coil homology domain-containing protein n=1 Tax=Cyberlindnera jadinii (strain ATCC 18201 / CBS 1600 / BCRC 20928 / JCM 3617 / NBRC 0987 / NRRL Y-1542) TaxID=983966 RepID=A0A0H5C2M5_CYBJN|nr:hypothetical protein CYBJADRAFT_185403 [Cyberlindnera jadinii NRRL Y-1542]ODV72779.1 hypothetical protein CYBJADRAFT_185403 [Cyberlindnera jadinii NRRL Y-1542]CEP22200.1 Syntaxin-8 AltName: Full=SNARE protein related to mammalian syntaxin 8; AltName: Full=ULP1-interacting protein 2 [Cyberlindnera jadinii]